MGFDEISEPFSSEEKLEKMKTDSWDPLSKRERARQVVDALVNEIPRVGRPSIRRELEQKLDHANVNVEEYLDLCSQGNLREEIIAASIDRYLVPAFPIILKKLSEQAKEGKASDVKIVVDLMSKVSALLSQFQKRNENHLHLHYEKMPEGQLLEEGLYQCKQFLKMQLQLPGGRKIVEQLFEGLLNEADRRNGKWSGPGSK